MYLENALQAPHFIPPVVGIKNADKRPYGLPGINPIRRYPRSGADSDAFEKERIILY